jgi:beta-lactamase superfamily II metal-dependent hydrolase
MATRRGSAAKNQIAKRGGKGRARARTAPDDTAPATDGGPGPKVRMYRVGFGDLFLLTVPSADGPCHVLVDCGVHAGNIGTLRTAVDDLAEATGRHLSLIVVTHRHADHLSGFATCAAQFAQFQVDAVWMSWWDDPADPQARTFQAALTSFAQQTAAPLALRAARPGEPAAAEAVAQALRMVRNVTGLDGAVAGAAAGGNEAALALLRGVPAGGPRFRNVPVRRYYKAGDEPELPADLAAAGVRATILGPPIDPALISQMSSAAQEYVALASEATATTIPLPFPARWRLERADAARVRARDGQLVELVRSVQPDAVLEAARRADNTLNNQSLVILFSVAGRKLLFVGDAQWGSWESFLYGGAAQVGATQLLPRSAEILSSLDFYKVGHHGSTNATPIAAVEALRKGCAAMCSTEPGCYGSTSKGTEVPRGALLSALMARTDGRLVRSDQIPAGDAAATEGLPAALPAAFTKGDLWIEWQP